MISIIVVNYNSGELLKQCIESVLCHIKIEWEIIIIDNLSTDNSISICEEYVYDNPIAIRKLDENVGFSKANNIGADMAKGDVLHFLNPDTALISELDYVYRNIESNCIYVNPWINRDNKSVTPRNKIPTIKDYFYFLYSPKRCRYWYTGASLIMTKETFNAIGRWNEEYFLYAEDLDLFYKCHLKGINIQLLSVPIYHYVGGCSSSVWSNYQRELRVQYSLKKFYEINNIEWQYPIMKLIFILKSLKHGVRTFMFELCVWIGFTIKQIRK